MICENSYYPDEGKMTRPRCRSVEKIAEDPYFKEQCPLIYFCTISERYEQTSDMFNCKYRGAKDDRQ